MRLGPVGAAEGEPSRAQARTLPPDHPEPGVGGCSPQTTPTAQDLDESSAQQSSKFQSSSFQSSSFQSSSFQSFNLQSSKFPRNSPKVKNSTRGTPYERVSHAPVPGEMLLEEKRNDTQKLYRWYRRTASPSCSSFAIIAWALLIRSCSGPLLLPLWVSAIGAI